MTDRYKNGKIYKLVSDVSEKIYIGSCCIPLPKRLYRHKMRYKYELNGVSRVGSPRELFKLNGNVSIILIELFPCGNKMELEKRERYWIENLECVNYRIPTRTQKEYKEENKEVILERSKEYREKNKEKIQERNKEYSKIKVI